MLPAVGLVLLLVLAPGEFRDLFNGKDFDGWVIEGAKSYTYKEGDATKTKTIWSINGDGHILCDAGRSGFGFLRYDKQQFGDFVFQVEFRMTPASKTVPRGNSGLGIRTGVFNPAKSAETRPSFAAYEIQLLDDSGKPPSAHGTGSLYRYLAPTANPIKPAPEWNTIEVECVGPRIKITVNGQQVLDADQNQVADISDKDKPKNAPAPKDKALKGYVCLQSHTGIVEFRKVRLKELQAEGGTK